jgi:mono/diheme cytochrome c family protein
VKSLPLLLGAAATVWACGFGKPGAASLNDAQLYSRYCARCHGEDGRGDPRSVGLNPALDLTRSALGKSRNHREVYQRIAFGYGPMPAYSRKLDPKEIERLTQYCFYLAEAR